MNINRLCPGCMRERENTAGACPYCGFSAADNANDTRCLPINTILAGKYLIGKVLGQGGFGITYMGFDLNMEARVAIKEYFPVEVVNRDTALSSGNRVFALDEEKRETFNRGLEKFVTEARNIARLVDVPGVVSVKEFFRENDTAYIVMEYIDGMSLSDYLTQRGGRIPEWEALNIIHPIIDALEKVHGLGMIHRDISPDNIMLSFDNDRVTSAKLIDFGSARVTTQDDQKSKTIILKHGYAPEEQYRTHGEQGTWTDVYAISAVLYRMLTGETPVSAMDRVLKDSLKGINQFGLQISKNTEKAVMKGLAVKKNDRTQTIAELSNALYSVPVQPTPEKPPKNITHIITERGGGHTHHTTSVEKTGVTGMDDGPNGAAGTVTAGRSSKKVGIIVAVAAIAVIAIVGIIIAVASSSGSSTGSTKAVEIVSWNPQTSYVASEKHAVFLAEDGTVTSDGSNQYGQRNVEDWEDIAAVAAGVEFTAGLKSDGTVLIAGQLENSEEVENWTDIIQLAVGNDTDGTTNYLFGLKTDGTIVVNKYSESFKDCLDLQNIKAITAYRYVFCALDESGKVSCINCRNLGAEVRQIQGWNDVQYIVSNMDVVMGLRTDGTVVGSKLWKDEKDFSYKWKNDNLNKLGELSNIKQLSLSYGILYAVASDGTVSSVEYNELSDEGKAQTEAITGYQNIAGVIQSIDGVPAYHVDAVSITGESKKYSVNYGTRTEDTMSNLKSVNVIDGYARGNAVLGITNSNNLIGYGTIQELKSFPSRSDEKIEKNVKDVEYFTYYNEDSEGRKGLLNSFCYLDTSGRLWMKKYDSGSANQYSGYQVVAENIKQISVIGKSYDLNDSHSAPFVAALTKNGKVKIISTDHVFKIPSNLKKAEDWKNITKVLCRYDEANKLYEIVGLKKDGTVTSIRSDGTKSETAKGWSNVKSIYGSTYAIAAVFKDGTVDFIKDEAHDEGQYATYDDERWSNIKSLALGLHHTVGLTKDGEVVVLGKNDSGQCDVDEFAGKEIKSIAAGESCTIGITDSGKMIVAGDIGW